VADDLDDVFARAEPPTHDTWQPHELKGREATYVRTAVRRLKEQCDKLSGAQARRSLKVGDYAVSSVAQRLGHLLAGPGGRGTAILTADAPTGRSTPFSGTDHGSAGGAAGGGESLSRGGQGREQRKRRPKLIGEPAFDIVHGIPVAVQQVELFGPNRVEASVKVLTGEGAPEKKSPLGVETPSIYGWRLTDGTFLNGDVLYHSGGPVVVDVLARMVRDVLVDINVMGRA